MCKIIDVEIKFKKKMMTIIQTDHDNEFIVLRPYRVEVEAMSDVSDSTFNIWTNFRSWC